MEVIAKGEHAPGCWGVLHKDDEILIQAGEPATPFSSMPFIRYTKQDGKSTWWIVFTCSWVHCDAELWVKAKDILAEAY